MTSLLSRRSNMNRAQPIYQLHTPQKTSYSNKKLNYRQPVAHRHHVRGRNATPGAFNPLIATLKPQSNGPSYSNIVIGTLAVDGWAVTFGTARRGLGGAAAGPDPSSLYQM